MIALLNLPPPSEQLRKSIDRIVNSSILDHDLKNQMDKIQGFKVNSISHTYEHDDELIDISKQEYQKYFPEDSFIPTVGVLVNHYQNQKLASFPPHADRRRIFCLNFYIKEGGEYVTTVFYDKYHNFEEGYGTGKMYTYNELSISSVHHCKMDNWYAMQVRQVHSVENIENVRIIYTLSFHHINMIDFFKKYGHYVKI